MAIKRAIHKYGKDNFIIEQIEQCNQEDLNDREKYWINFYDSYRNGYNSTLGGQDTPKLPKLLYKTDEIIDLYNAGFSLRELAREYNVDHATIKLILTKNKIPLRTVRTYKLSSENRVQILTDYNNGISRKSIMEKYNISKSYLSQLINGRRRI